MKILHYTGRFSPYSETFIYDSIINLEKRGIKNIVLTNKRLLKKERPFKKVIIVNDENILNKIIRKIFNLRRANFKHPKKIKKIIEDVFPDVIHAHFGPNGILIYNLLRRYNVKIPLVISFHGTDINSLPKLYKWYAQEIKKIGQNKDVFFTAPTNFLKNKMIDQGIKKESISIIPNSFNPNFTKTRKRHFFKKGDTLRIINIGRLIDVKGQKYLINGFAKFVREVYPNSTLTLIGEGPNKRKLKRRVNKLGIKNKVFFLGAVKHSKIPRILKKHDVYVQPSIKDKQTFEEESFGIVILEAIGSGLPVIVTKTGGMPEVIIKDNQQDSFIISEKNSEAIYRVFKRMVLGDYNFKSNKKYLKEILLRFSYKKYLNNLISVYRRSISNFRQKQNDEQS